jgi:hypothetical protein
MNAVHASRTPALPEGSAGAREALRENLLSQIFGKGRGSRDGALPVQQRPERVVPPAAGKGYYVDVYV